MNSAKSDTIGALDLGGASTQITFIPQDTKDIPEEMSSTFTLYGHKYTVFTHSCLCFGQNEAQRKLKASLVLVRE